MPDRTEASFSHEDVKKCAWCDEDFTEDELLSTDIGDVCYTCLQAIRSRGETIDLKG